MVTAKAELAKLEQQKAYEDFLNDADKESKPAITTNNLTNDRVVILKNNDSVTAKSIRASVRTNGSLSQNQVTVATKISKQEVKNQSTAKPSSVSPQIKSNHKSDDKLATNLGSALPQAGSVDESGLTTIGLILIAFTALFGRRRKRQY